MLPLSVTIITLDEADQIGGAIDSVSWADEIIVVDAGSTDDTCDIARRKGARVSVRRWTGWVDQKNHAASLATHDWILSLDADERVTPALASEIRDLLSNEPPLRGYRAPRVTQHLGRWIRTTDFYPDYQARLYDRRVAQWRGNRVHESVVVPGATGQLQHEIEHYSFADLADQLTRINAYSTLAARDMFDRGRRAGALALLAHPPAAFFRNYILRRGFLDGTAGLLLSMVNGYAVFVKLAKLWELERTGRTEPAAATDKPESSRAPAS